MPFSCGRVFRLHSKGGAKTSIILTTLAAGLLGYMLAHGTTDGTPEGAEIGAALRLLLGQLLLLALLCVLARGYGLVDKEGDGKISADEIPFLASFARAGRRCVDGGEFFDWGMYKGGQVLCDAWSSAPGWTALLVLACNVLLYPVLPQEWGWAVVALMTYFILMFMCTFSTYGVHSITTHEIHFVYYGCGLCMNAMYLGAPPPWILWPTLFAIDVLHTVSKFVVWPNYPEPFMVLPTYARDESGNLVKVCEPEENGYLAKCQSAATRLGRTPGLPFHIHLAWPFPIYEQMHAHCTGNMFFGGAVGKLARVAFGGLDSMPLSIGLWAACTVRTKRLEATPLCRQRAYPR